MNTDEKAKHDRELKRIAANYVKVFESDSGRVVMADLLNHFDPAKPRFTITRTESVLAAKIDGQADVMNHIFACIKRAEPKTETE